MKDRFLRPIDYLRVSITDRCNMRCTYCMPPQGVSPKSHDDMLRYEEILRLVRISAQLGISKIRVTGGEPLVRKGVVAFIGGLNATTGIDEVTMTTNGALLGPLAPDLAAAGLARVNISLDTLKPARFQAITRTDLFDSVWQGIESALREGLDPVKINVVLVRGQNDDEVADFARLTLERPLHVRFIEVMPLGEGAEMAMDRFVPASEIMDIIKGELGLPLVPLDNPSFSQVAASASTARADGDDGVDATDAVEDRFPVPIGQGPARYWRLAGAPGTIGLITAISEHFCATCNRLRLTAEGVLNPCLARDIGVNLREPLRRGASDEDLLALVEEAVVLKPVGHHMRQEGPDDEARRRRMSRLGG